MKGARGSRLFRFPESETPPRDPRKKGELHSQLSSDAASLVENSGGFIKNLQAQQPCMHF